MAQLAFVLVRETNLVTEPDLYRLGRALEVNARHCAEAWGIQAPTIDVVNDADKVPHSVYHPIRFRSHTDDDPGAGAVHYFDPIRGGPAAIVYVDRASGFNSGRSSVAEFASHEVVEALINPRVNLWLPHPSPLKLGVQVAREVGDPTQATYDVHQKSTSWKMTSFVTPAWFDAANHDPEMKRRVMAGGGFAGGGFDYARELDGPGDVGPEGYVILRERRGDRWHVYFEDSSGTIFGAAPAKPGHEVRGLSPSSRSKLLAQAE
jgi:hypothetical protein